jgi:CRP-like cAMP-binding protein
MCFFVPLLPPHWQQLLTTHLQLITVHSGTVLAVEVCMLSRCWVAPSPVPAVRCGSFVTWIPPCSKHGARLSSNLPVTPGLANGWCALAQGKPMDRTYVLLSGCVALTLAQTGQPPSLQELLTQGQLFGECAGIAEHQLSWPYTATARGEVQLGFFGVCASV